MRISISEARKRLGEIVIHVQDPNHFVVVTRHGKPVAGIVSMSNLERIWQQEDEQDRGLIWHPLYKIRHAPGRKWSPLEIGRGGKMVSKREAALQLRTLQLNRADERRILREGGLEPVQEGELMEERPGWVTKLWRRWGRP